MDEQQQQLVTPASGGGNPPNLTTNTQPSKRGSVSGGGGGGGRGGQNQQPQQPPQMLKDIVAPHQHDVLCGRGGGTNNHVGNELFRTLVNNKKRAYLNSCKRDKPSVSRGIVASIRGLDPPGRFLSRDEHTGLWFDIGDQKAREKTSQALREGAPEIRKEMGFREWPDGAAAGKPPGGPGPGPGGYNRSASAPAHVLSSMMQMQHHRHRQHQQQPPQPPSQQSQPQPPPPQPPQPQQRPQPRPSQGGGVNPPPSMASAGLPPPQTSFQADAAAASQELRGLPRRPSEPAASGTGGETGQQAAGAPPSSTSHAFPSHITPDAAKVLIQFLQTQQAKDAPGGMVSSALSPSQQQAVAAGAGAEDLASASAQTALLKAAYQQQQLELQSQSERLQQLTQRLQLQQQQQAGVGGGEQQPPQTPPTSHHMSPSLVQHQFDAGGHRRPSTLVEQLVTGSPAAGGSELVPPTTTMSRGPSGGDPTGLAMERMRRASLAEQQQHQLHQRMDNVPVARSASHSFADADGDAAGTEMSVPASPGKTGQSRPSSMVDDTKEREEDDDMDYLKDLPPDVRNRLEVAEYLAECHRSGRGAREDEEGGAIGEVRRNAELFQTLGLLGVDAAVIGKAMREGRPLKSLVEEAVAAEGEKGAAAAAPVVAASSASSAAAGVAVKMEGVDDTAVTRQVTDDDMVVPGSKGADDEDVTKRVDPALEGGTKEGAAATTGSVAKGSVGEQDMDVDKGSTTRKGDAPVKKRKLMERTGDEDSRQQPFFPRNRIQDALSRMGVVASE